LIPLWSCHKFKGARVEPKSLFFTFVAKQYLVLEKVVSVQDIFYINNIVISIKQAKKNQKGEGRTKKNEKLSSSFCFPLFVRVHFQ